MSALPVTLAPHPTATFVARLAFVVPGVPVPAARARVVKGRAFTPATTAAFEARVALHARAARALSPGWPSPADHLRYRVTLHVWRAADRGDADNFCKAVKDGVTKAGSVWQDDRRVVDERTVMFLDRLTPRTEVEVEAFAVDVQAERKSRQGRVAPGARQGAPQTSGAVSVRPANENALATPPGPTKRYSRRQAAGGDKAE